MAKANRQQKIVFNTTAEHNLAPTTFWRIAQDIPQSWSWALISRSIIVPLVTWFLITKYAGIDSIFLPSPADVIEAFQRLWSKGYLPKDKYSRINRFC